MKKKPQKKFRIDVTKNEAKSIVDVLMMVPVDKQTAYSIKLLKRLIDIREGVLL